MLLHIENITSQWYLKPINIPCLQCLINLPPWSSILTSINTLTVTRSSFLCRLHGSLNNCFVLISLRSLVILRWLLEILRVIQICHYIFKTMFFVLILLIVCRRVYGAIITMSRSYYITTVFTFTIIINISCLWLRLWSMQTLIWNAVLTHILVRFLHLWHGSIRMSLHCSSSIFSKRKRPLYWRLDNIFCSILWSSLLILVGYFLVMTVDWSIYLCCILIVSEIIH
jgi:hypothetical protein